MAPSGDAKLLFCSFFIACCCLTGELTQGHRNSCRSLFSSYNGLYHHRAKQDPHISENRFKSLVDSEGKVWRFSAVPFLSADAPPAIVC